MQATAKIIDPDSVKVELQITLSISQFKTIAESLDSGKIPASDFKAVLKRLIERTEQSIRAEQKIDAGTYY